MKFNNDQYNINEYDDKKDYCFSGGEIQRLAIARIFLKNPKILLLDEITSFLDKKNEKIILESLQKYMKNKTIIYISHRLDTIENCDKIFIFKNGKIVEKESNSELLKIKRKY